MVQQFARHAVGLSRGPEARYRFRPIANRTETESPCPVAYFVGSRLLNLFAHPLRGPKSTCCQSEGIPVAGSIELPPPHLRPLKTTAVPQRAFIALDTKNPRSTSIPVARQLR